MKVCTCTLIGIKCAACESTHARQRARTGGGTLHPNRAGVACENTHACQPARTGGGTLHLNRAGVRQQHCFIMAIVTRVELAAARCFHAASPAVVRTARWVVIASLRHMGGKTAGNRRVSKQFSRCGAHSGRPGMPSTLTERLLAPCSISSSLAIALCY